jgi:transcriptional regulator with XRE-family HTH domain
MSDISHIDGQSVRLKRETMGLAMADLATLACLSVKQIKQIEEGGTSAFYSENVKLTAARKVAALLHMTEDQLFGQVPAEVAQVSVTQDEVFLPVDNAPLAGVLTAGDANPEPAQAPLMRSEALHILAQPPEDLETQQAAAPEQQDAAPEHGSSVHPVLEQDIKPELESAGKPSEESAQEASTPEAGSNYILKIFALFILAIALAALLRPKTVEDKAETTNQESAAPAPTPMPVPGATNDNQSGAATETQPAVANSPVANSPVLPAAATTEKPAVPATTSPAAGEAVNSTTGK